MRSISQRTVHARVRFAFIACILFSAPSAAQQPLLSPRDSVELRLEGSRIFIDYGRPSMRGRKIFGGLVPYNKWWRTGANEATSFMTDIDLYLGDSLVKAGSYTLYTLPSARRWQLIVNRQTGQWGTVYNPEYDVYRLRMTKTSLRKPVEKFTVALERKNRTSGVLILRWETTEVSIPFRIARTNDSTRKER